MNKFWPLFLNGAAAGVCTFLVFTNCRDSQYALAAFNAVLVILNTATFIWVLTWKS